jgi:hypothetical protein
VSLPPLTCLGCHPHFILRGVGAAIGVWPHTLYCRWAHWYYTPRWSPISLLQHAYMTVQYLQACSLNLEAEKLESTFTEHESNVNMIEQLCELPRLRWKKRRGGSRQFEGDCRCRRLAGLAGGLPWQNQRQGYVT